MKGWLVGLVVLLSPSAFAQQLPPELPYDSVANLLKLPPDMHLGEAAGVAVNSKGHIFVYSRGGSSRGPAYGNTASQILEFDRNGTFLREIGRNLYAWAFAHTVRIDKDDNIWATDKGSDMVVKFTPEGRVDMVFGRKSESSDLEAHPWERNTNPPLPHVDGRFRQPTDVTWDPQGNVYISDGYVNSRVAKYDKNGEWMKSWGHRGKGPGEFNLVHSGGSFTPGAPWALCITPPPNQVLYSSDSYPGRVYKLSLDGKVLGYFGNSGKQLKQFGWIHEIVCPSENELYVAEILNWRVQKLILRPEQQKAAADTR